MVLQGPEPAKPIPPKKPDGSPAGKCPWATRVQGNGLRGLLIGDQNHEKIMSDLRPDPLGGTTYDLSHFTHFCGPGFDPVEK